MERSPQQPLSPGRLSKPPPVAGLTHPLNPPPASLPHTLCSGSMVGTAAQHAGEGVRSPLSPAPGVSITLPMAMFLDSPPTGHSQVVQWGAPGPGRPVRALP